MNQPAPDHGGTRETRRHAGITPAPVARDDTPLRAGDLLDVLRALWPASPSSAPTRPLEPAAGGATPPVAALLGRFRVERELGRGGFGIVFLAEDTLLRRPVALKIPRPDLVASGQARARFLTEARAAALDHPNIAPLYEAGEAGPVLYLALAYCPGGSLADWLRGHEEPAPPRAAARVVARLARALHFVHGRGILHRDLKPSNVLLWPAAGEEGADPEFGFVPRVCDFGVAKFLEEGGAETTTGVLTGTPEYMAPEQAEGRTAEVGPPTDVHGLGCILYELLTGRPPFKGRTLLDTLDRVRGREAEPPAALRPGLPRDLQSVCLRCLEKDPRRRYPTALALAEDLERFLAGERVAARPRGPLDQLAAWSRRPERVTAAGTLLFAVGLLLAVYCVAGLVLLATGGMHAERPDATWRYVLGHLLVFYLPMMGLGWAVLAGRRAAFWPGAALAVGFLLWMGVLWLTNYATGRPVADMGIDRPQTGERLLGDLLVTAVAVVPVVAFLAAVPARLAGRARAG